MSLSPGVHGGHGLAGSSLLTVAAVLDCIQAEPDGGGFDFGMSKQFYTMSFLPSCAEGTRLPVALFSRWQ